MSGLKNLKAKQLYCLMQHGCVIKEQDVSRICLIRDANDTFPTQDEDSYDLPDDWRPSLPDLSVDDAPENRCPSPKQYIQVGKQHLQWAIILTTAHLYYQDKGHISQTQWEFEAHNTCIKPFIC